MTNDTLMNVLLLSRSGVVLLCVTEMTSQRRRMHDRATAAVAAESRESLSACRPANGCWTVSDK